MSSQWEKEREHESWGDRVSWVKRNNISWRERESRYGPWIFFLVFFHGFNMLVHWFCLHRVESSVSPLFGAHLPIIFAAIHLRGNCSTECLFLFTLIANSLKPSLPHSSAWCRREEHPFLLVSFQHRRFVTSSFSSQLTQSITRDELTHNQR